MGDVDRIRRAGASRPGLFAARVALPVLAALAGCADPAGRATPAEPEALSLLGTPLFAPPLAEEVRLEREAQLEAARIRHAADPGDADALIWFGRRTAYLGRYREAIDIFTGGIERFPEDARMYRHRGHRFITVRRFADAVRDLERGAALIAGVDDQVEPDGLPNARNIPTSTLHANIWYHLGLAYYLQDDLENAARSYRECLRFSTNPDMLCATSHWLYMTLRRQGLAAEAAALLLPIHAELDVIENDGYHRLLLMYKGELTSEELLPRDADGTASATVAYGVANWQRLGGEVDRGRLTLLEIVEGGEWAAFGAIAAEADLLRWVE